MEHTNDFSLRGGTVDDIPALVDILNYYVEHSFGLWLYSKVSVEEKIHWFHQTFDKPPVEEGVTCPSNYFVVCVNNHDNSLAGYAYYAPFRERAGWRFTKETSVYVHQAYLGRGIGSLLYKNIIEHARNSNVKALMGIIGGENDASVALHKKLGFRFVGTLSNVGEKNDKALDAHFYQLSLTD